MVDYYFDLPIDPGGVPRIIHVSQYDTGRMYFMRLVKNGSPFIPPADTYAVIIGTNAKLVPFELSAGLERTNVTTNGVTTTTEVHCVRELDPVVTDGDGLVPIQVVLKRDDETIEGGEDILGTAVVILDVHRGAATKEDIANAPYFMDAIVTAVNDWLDEHPPASGGMTDEIKQALLDCFEHVAWIDEDGQDYYDELYNALYPPVDVLSISAVFTQGDNVIYDTDSLDDLKQYLVVTATMTDSTTRTLEDTDYTLSGTLAEGTSTITVSYGGKTDTFSVTVTRYSPLPSGYTPYDYIASNGSAYIQIQGVNILTGFKVHTIAMSSAFSSSATKVACGGGTNNYYVAFAAYRKTENEAGAYYGTAISAYDEFPSLYSQKTDFVTRFTNNGCTVTVTNGGTTKTITQPKGTATMEVVSTFRIGTSGASGSVIVGRIYLVEVMNGSDEMVFQFLPCVRNSDSKAGMYDVIGETFYPSSSDTAFTVGND